MKISNRRLRPIARLFSAGVPEPSPALRRTVLPRVLALLAALLAGNGLAARSSAQSQNTAVATPFFPFSTTAQGGYPYGGLVKAPDGGFYGTGGFLGGYGLVYKLSAAGQFSVLYQFPGGDQGSNPAHLLLGSDGNLYGTAGGGPSNDGLLFQLTPAGGYTVLHDFRAATDGSSPSSLVQGSDGTLFGTTSNGGPGTNSAGTVFNATLAGKVTVLHTYTFGVEAYPTALIAGSDGNFYGATEGNYAPYYGGISTPATVFQITPAGGYKVIADLPINNSGQGSNTLVQPGPVSLIQASDGNFYGTTGAEYDEFEEISSEGTIFRVTAAGTYTNLHVFDVTDGYNPAGLTEGSNGDLYGVTGGGGYGGLYEPFRYTYGDGTAFQITKDGVFTSLCSFTSGTDGAIPNGRLFEVGPGVFLGTDDNEIFQLTLVPHPDFFAGQAPLADQGYYLAFPNGNYFGYYTFLSDPNYLYHFDLGFEYLIDANDDRGGIYLYDFTSGGFFYTAPNFPFPFLYDFNLKSIVYYFPNPENPGRYNFYGSRYFYDFATSRIIVK